MNILIFPLWPPSRTRGGFRSSGSWEANPKQVKPGWFPLFGRGQGHLTLGCSALLSHISLPEIPVPLARGKLCWSVTELPRLLPTRGNRSQQIPGPAGILIFPSQQQTGLPAYSKCLKPHFKEFNILFSPQGSSSPQGIWFYLLWKLQRENEAGNDEIISLHCNESSGLRSPEGQESLVVCRPFKISEF